MESAPNSYVSGLAAGRSEYFAELAALGLPIGRSRDLESKPAFTRGSFDSGSRGISTTGVQAEWPLKDTYPEGPCRTNTERDKDCLVNRTVVTFADPAPDLVGDGDATSARRLSFAQEMELNQSRQAAHDSAQSLLDIRQRITQMECNSGKTSLDIAAILRCVMEMKFEMQQSMTSLLRWAAVENTASKQAPFEHAEQNVSREQNVRPEGVEEKVPQVTLRRSADDRVDNCPDVDNVQVDTPVHATPPQVFPTPSAAMQADCIKASKVGGDATLAMYAVTGDGKTSTEELRALWKCELRTSLENVEQEMKNEMRNQMHVTFQNLLNDLPAVPPPDSMVFPPVSAIRTLGNRPRSLSSGSRIAEDSSNLGGRPRSLTTGSRIAEDSVVLHELPSMHTTTTKHATFASNPLTVSQISDDIMWTHDMSQMNVDELQRASKWSKKVHRKTETLMANLSDEYEAPFRPSIEYVADHESRETLRSQRTIFQKVIDGALYQSLMLLLVLTQAVGMGVEAQQQMRYHWATFQDKSQNRFSQPPSMFSFNVVLNSVFIVDLVLRVSAWRSQFFRTKDKEMFYWNAFDAFLVVVSTVDYFPDGGTISAGKISLLRSMRLLRVVRILRMVGFFSELRKIVMSFFGGMTQLFWVGSLLSLVLYVFALLFMQGASDELSNMDRARLLRQPNITADFAGTDVDMPSILFLFGTVKETMVNLFATITGGREWFAILGPLMIVSDLYYWVSVIYVLFFVFGFLNVVTATFVDRAAVAITSAEAEAKQKSQAVENHRMEQHILELFGGGNVEMSLDGLVEVFKDVEVQEWLFTFGIDVSKNITHIVAMLLPKEDTGCTAARFLKTLRLLKGELTRYDFQMLMFETQRGFNMVNAFQKRTHDEISRIVVRQQEDQQCQREEMERVLYLLDGMLKWLSAPSGADVNV